MADTEQLRMKFLLELKRVEQLLAKGQLEGLETLLLGSQLLLNQRKAAMAAVLQLGTGWDEGHQREEIRHRVVPLLTAVSWNTYTSVWHAKGRHFDVRSSRNMKKLAYLALDLKYR